MIWRLALAAFLACGIALFAINTPHAQFNGCPAGFCNPPKAGSAAVSPSFDAGARTTTGSYINPTTLTLTTTHTPDEIIVFAAINGCTGVDTYTATSSHLTFTRRVSTGSANPCGGTTLTEFTAQSSGTLSSEVITITCSPCAGFTYQEAYACAFYNMNTGAPFDPNGSLPDAATSGATNISTTHAADMLMVGFRGGSGITPDAGWSSCANIDFGGGEYKQVSTTQSGVAVTGGVTNNGRIGDALQGP